MSALEISFKPIPDSNQKSAMSYKPSSPELNFLHYSVELCIAEENL